MISISMYGAHHILDTVFIEGQVPIIQEYNTISTLAKDTWENTWQGCSGSSIAIEWQRITKIWHSIANCSTFQACGIEQCILINLDPVIEEGILIRGFNGGQVVWFEIGKVNDIQGEMIVIINARDWDSRVGNLDRFFCCPWSFDVDRTSWEYII